MKTTIVNAHVISPGVDLENAVVVVEDGRIKSVRKGPVSAKADKNNTVVDVRGQYLMPGFIDVHTHGALGYDFCDADEIAFAIVHDPARAAKIVERRRASVRMSIDRKRLSGTARIDLAAFGRGKGTMWGAPTFVSFSVIDTDAPYYDPALVPQLQVK